MKQFFNSPNYKRLTFWIGLTVLLLLTFQGGIFVGFHKASMAYQFDERYRGAYGSHFRSGPFGLPQDDFPEAHGAAGRVLSVSLPTIVIEDKNSERIVLLNDETVIRKDRDKVGAETIMANDFVVVIGAPNEKQEVVAKFIRMLPPPPSFTPSTTSAATNTKVTN